MLKKVYIVGIILFFFIVNMPSSVIADEHIPPTPTADEVNAIAKNLFCPVCESTPLDVCGTDACIQWREQIKEKLTLGWSENEIYEYFISLYGDRVLAQPPKTGLNWLIYIIPPAAILFTILIFFKNGKKWQQENQGSSEEKLLENTPFVFQEQIEEDMKNYE